MPVGSRPGSIRPGITRVRVRGGGFRYQRPDGTWIKDVAELERIHQLAVPPAWIDVWISDKPRARVQATGRDSRGRLQYRYHPAFRRSRDAQKFAGLVEFGRLLPRLRRRVDRDLRRRGLPRDKVLAGVVAILEATRIRIGNREYAEANHSYGLTTLLPQQVMVEGDTARFVFRGKSGRRHRVVLEDARLAHFVARCRSTPGHELFQYETQDGTWEPVRSDDVNAYLREATGGDFTAKSIRTWSASVLALQLLRSGRRANEPRPRSAVGRAIQVVADALGNTPTISRSAYVHPDVIDWYLDQAPDPGIATRGAPWLSTDERRLIALLGGVGLKDRTPSARPNGHTRPSGSRQPS
jgi:DNA topoisomerase-1